MKKTKTAGRKEKFPLFCGVLKLLDGDKILLPFAAAHFRSDFDNSRRSFDKKRLRLATKEVR